MPKLSLGKIGDIIAGLVGGALMAIVSAVKKAISKK